MQKHLPIYFMIPFPEMLYIDVRTAAHSERFSQGVHMHAHSQHIANLISPALRAWNRAGAPAADFAAAVAAMPPRIGSAGWAARWAAKAALAAEDARRYSRMAAMAAAVAGDYDTPHWGVVKVYGTHSWSNHYNYEVRARAGTMTREEANAAAKAARESDARCLASDAAWDDYMSW